MTGREGEKGVWGGRGGEGKGEKGKGDVGIRREGREGGSEGRGVGERGGGEEGREGRFGGEKERGGREWERERGEQALSIAKSRQDPVPVSSLPYLGIATHTHTPVGRRLQASLVTASVQDKQPLASFPGSCGGSGVRVGS